MKTWAAILLIAILVFVCVLEPLLSIPIVFGTSLWVFIDSSKIELRKYKSVIAARSVVLFIACIMLWILFFPWYLSMRYKIKNGLAQLKDEYRSEG